MAFLEVVEKRRQRIAPFNALHVGQVEGVSEFVFEMAVDVGGDLLVEIVGDGEGRIHLGAGEFGVGAGYGLRRRGMRLSETLVALDGQRSSLIDAAHFGTQGILANFLWDGAMVRADRCR